MSVIERYTRATRSSNLKCDEYHSAIDNIAAVGMSDDAFGALLLRVKYAFDPTSYAKLKEEWRYYVKVKAVVHDWPQDVNERIVADMVLAYWLRDHCRPCGGRKHLELAPQVLQDEPCPHCKGSGKRDLIVNRRFKKYAYDMHDAINRLVVRVGGEAEGKLREEDVVREE
jgi:hypothetical protein